MARKKLVQKEFRAWLREHGADTFTCHPEQCPLSVYLERPIQTDLEGIGPKWATRFIHNVANLGFYTVETVEPYPRFTGLEALAVCK